LPLGESVWSDTKLVLPQEAPDRWVDTFTRAKISAEASKGEKLMPLSYALKNFPVALLDADGFHA
jgi:maltooligosyltrehalose synthase